MTDYTITTNFGAKDSLPSGNAGKVIKGEEFTTEFTNIQTAVNTKADTAGDTFTGVVNFSADVAVNTNTLFVDVSEAKVGIGTTSPDGKLDIEGDFEATKALVLTNTKGAGKVSYIRSHGANGEALSLYHDGQRRQVWDSTGYISFEGTGGEERMRIDSSGNVGIGITSPDQKLQVDGNIRLGDTASGVDDDEDYGLITGGQLTIHANDSGENVNYTGLVFDVGNASSPVSGSANIVMKTKQVEAMRIDASSNLLVAKTAVNTQAVGIELRNTGKGMFTASATDPVFVNRLSTDGEIVKFAKDGTVVGSIGTVLVSNSRYFYIGSTANPANTGIGFYDLGIYPSHSDGSFADNGRNLGSSSVRWNDIYATNNVIQTSDRNEKQGIRELLDAEQRVATACKGLLRAFKWNSSVEEKGDEARIHFGIIAQDLQDAFTAEGLDAGDYAMFINSTWTDEETGEERSRMGVRYSELLAFIISAI